MTLRSAPHRGTQLGAALVRASMRIALRIAHKPALPSQKYWTLHPAPTGYVVFGRDQDPLYEFHVSAMVDGGPFAYYVEAARMEPLVRPLRSPLPAEDVVPALFEAGALYVVGLRPDWRRRQQREQMTGACDCVAIVKRALGIYAPHCFTPRQLLSELWYRSRIHEQSC